MYLNRQKLFTHLYPEIIDEISRSNVYEFENLAAFPRVGVQRYYYKALDSGIYYTYDGSVYNITSFTDVVLIAINTAIGEAKGYLNRYDLLKMFSDDDSVRTFQDDLLDTKVKDLVQWHLIRLCNVNVNFEISKTAYDDAMKYFEKVQRGIIDPNWPLIGNDPSTPQDESGLIQFTSLDKRTNHY